MGKMTRDGCELSTTLGNRVQGSKSDTGLRGRNYPEGRLLSTAGRALQGRVSSLLSTSHDWPWRHNPSSQPTWLGVFLHIVLLLGSNFLLIKQSSDL